MTEIAFRRSARGGLAPRCETQWRRAWITSWSKDSLVGKDSASC
jgi:hypothetical protein